MMLFVSCKDESLDYDLIIVGGGASGVTAGIQAGRQGVKTLIIEETPWIGGMLTAAGVSAIDGNHEMPSGLWGEFRDSLYRIYGGYKGVATGWVSHCLFEPAIAERVLSNMVNATPSLSLVRSTSYKSVFRVKDHWEITINNASGVQEHTTKILIDATELGDIVGALNLPADIGMDDGDSEPQGPELTQDIIQDLTYVITLKDFGPQENRTIQKPENYNPEEFSCACDPSGTSDTIVSCDQMLAYGKLPNGKYMINWPNCGNDTYLNLINLTKEERNKALVEAKETTLRFTYFIQHTLGYKNLGIFNEYGTEDSFPFIPYHRESRRTRGKVRLISDHLTNPFNYNLYRTGVAVGDYPIDHHHDKNEKAPEIDFLAIKVPSYNIPLGALIPKNQEGLIVAEKSISVSNIVNGTTRLQPVVMGIGQSAGALASYVIKNQLKLSEVNPREVQETLLQDKAYIMPYMDVKKEDKDFEIIQKIGATGILRGKGIPYKWANQTWFYPDTVITSNELVLGLSDFYGITIQANDDFITKESIVKYIQEIKQNSQEEEILNYITEQFPNHNDKITKRMLARIINHFLDPFSRPINLEGKII